MGTLPRGENHLVGTELKLRPAPTICAPVAADRPPPAGGQVKVCPYELVPSRPR